MESMNTSEPASLERKAENGVGWAARELCEQVIGEEHFETTDDQFHKWRGYILGVSMIGGGGLGSESMEQFNPLLFTGKNNKPWAQRWLVEAYTDTECPVT